MADEGSGSQQRDRAGSREERRHHFLIVAYGVQGHINPARALAHRLVRLGGGVDGSVRATLCLTVPTHRRLFPSSSPDDEEASDGVVSYVPYSDGLAYGAFPKDAEERARSRRAGSESLSGVIARLTARGRPVTCVMCTMVVLPALDAASAHGLPLAAFWIQPAHVLAAFYHYVHGYGDLVAPHVTDPAYEVSLPGLTRPLRVRDFPSFLVDTTGSELYRALIDATRELFEFVDRRRARLLVNTFDALEPGVLAEFKRRRGLDVSAVGPMVLGSPTTEARIHLFQHGAGDRKRYMDWLDARPEEASVVYVSFGSLAKFKRRQMEEVVRGLRRCGRPYLLVVRKDELEEEDTASFTSNDDGVLDDTTTVHGNQAGMVVEWCDQLEVVSHAAVGCFVTHCGWNSTLEAVVSGVPVVAVPNMFDQPTNAYLVKEEWQIGTRVERDGEGVLTGAELARCIELVMGEGDEARAIRERAKALKMVAQEAAVAGGHADRNLRDFLNTII